MITMRTATRAMLRATITAAIATGLGGPVSAQVTDARVREVVRTSKATDVFATVANDIITGMTTLDPAADPTRVTAVVRTHFATDALVEAVVRYIRDHADPDVFNELHAWLLSDSIRRIEARSDSAADRMTLEQYMQSHSPTEDVVAAATRFADVMEAGEFYLRYITSLQKAALETARAGGMAVPPMPELSAEQREAAMQQFTQIAVVSFIQRFDPLTPEEIEVLTRAYATRSGAWYVNAYIEAVAAALDNAGRNAIAALQS